jgi:uncharacterized membrane protein YvbJ
MRRLWNLMCVHAGLKCPPHMKFCPKCGHPFTQEAKKSLECVEKLLVKTFSSLTDQQKLVIIQSLPKKLRC